MDDGVLPNAKHLPRAKDGPSAPMREGAGERATADEQAPLPATDETGAAAYATTNRLMPRREATAKTGAVIPSPPVSIKDIPFPLVWIEWKDTPAPATSRLVWAKDVRPATMPRCVAVGFLVHDTADMKVIVADLRSVMEPGDPKVCGALTIPASAIVRMFFLRKR